MPSMRLDTPVPCVVEEPEPVAVPEAPKTTFVLQQLGQITIALPQIVAANTAAKLLQTQKESSQSVYPADAQPKVVTGETPQVNSEMKPTTIDEKEESPLDDPAAPSNAVKTTSESNGDMEDVAQTALTEAKNHDEPMPHYVSM